MIGTTWRIWDIYYIALVLNILFYCFRPVHSIDLWLGIGQISAYGVQRETYNTSLHYFAVSMHIE